MENFLSSTNEHNTNFFQTPQQDEESEMITDPQQSSSNSSPIKTEVKVDRPRPNLKIDEEANIKLQVLVSNFSDEQLDRYEMYRRSAFSKISIKRLMHSITGSVPSSNVVIAMAGIAKVFVGELVEEALEVQRTEKPHINETKPTPLEPKHLREANRRINNNNNHCPQKKTWKSKRKSRF